MDSIFHEKLANVRVVIGARQVTFQFTFQQEGSLCAQHCLNALLQGPYFTPVDLATLAQRMDDEERLRMAESGVDTAEYQQFMQQPSGNMDDSGYFSVQVISSALEVWGLELVPYTSSEPLAVQAQQHPESMTAYICHYRDHWFAIRKLGFQWFNLNSLLSGPELVSDTYLTMLLAQLQQEGYSIFVVSGDLPPSRADEVLKITPAVQVVKPALKPTPVQVDKSDSELEKAIRMSLNQEEDVEEDEQLQAALRLSLQDDGPDPALERALQLSLQVDSPLPTAILDQEEIRRRRLAYLENKESCEALNSRQLNT